MNWHLAWVVLNVAVSACAVVLSLRALSVIRTFRKQEREWIDSLMDLEERVREAERYSAAQWIP